MAVLHNDKKAYREALEKLAQKLVAAKHSEKRTLVEEHAATFGYSPSTVYRQLKSVGWDSDRKTRSDCGKTCQDEKALQELGAALRLGVRKNGKVTMQTPNARSLLAANGREFNVTNSRLNTLLRERKLNTRQQQKASPHIRMRSLHPNHVHQVDPSLCLIYYFKGKQHIVTDDQWYKNKPDNVIEQFKVWRYVLVDHFSCTINVRYVEAKGENQSNLYDFLLHTWGINDNRPFHGVPKILVWDKGSANTAKAIKNALRALQIDAIEHEAGNPRAKGAVEWANNEVEKLFESRLKYEPVDNVDELNAAAERWQLAYNSNSIPHYDSRLKRRGMRQPLARYELWQTIRKEQLRLLPEAELCRALLSADPVTRKVNASLCISFKHPKAKASRQYDLAHIPEVFNGFEVSVSPIIYGDLQIIVSFNDYSGQTVEHIIGPIEIDETSGMPINAPVFGDSFASRPDTDIENAGKRVDKLAYPGQSSDEIKKSKEANKVPFNGKIDAHSHLGNVYVPEYIKRPGTELNVPSRMSVEEKPLTHIEAIKRINSILGRDISMEENQSIRAWYPDGVPENELSDLVERIRSGHKVATIKAVK